MSRLSRDDWAIAALAALASGGLSAVAVEPLAARLGATKGSFYWHFKARHELIQAALDLWEQRSTADVIKDLEELDRSPETRLRALFARVFEPEALTGADMALLAHSQEPPVREALQRVTQERIDYVALLLEQCGLPTSVARRRAVFAYSAFLGHLQLRHSASDLLRHSVGSFDRYADELVATLLDQK